jgi:hypothetical protein
MPGHAEKFKGTLPQVVSEAMPKPHVETAPVYGPDPPPAFVTSTEVDDAEAPAHLWDKRVRS